MDWVISLLLLVQFSGSSVKSSWIAEGPAGCYQTLRRSAASYPVALLLCLSDGRLSMENAALLLSGDWWPEQVWLALPGETEQMTASSGSEFCDLSNKIRAFTLPGYFICSLIIIIPQSVLSSLLDNFWENNNDEILLLLNFVPYLLVAYSYLVY